MCSSDLIFSKSELGCVFLNNWTWKHDAKLIEGQANNGTARKKMHQTKSAQRFLENKIAVVGVCDSVITVTYTYLWSEIIIFEMVKRQSRSRQDIFCSVLTQSNSLQSEPSLLGALTYCEEITSIYFALCS